MTTAAPVHYSPDLEDIRLNEEEVVSGLNESFDVILKRTAEDYGHAVRSEHAKGHGLLKGTMTVRDNLPIEFAQGLFSGPGSYDVSMRMSTNAGDILPDTIALPRGLAMKVVGVEGPRLPDGDGSSQDFVMVNGPVFQAPKAEKFLGNLKMLVTSGNTLP
jgi:catalase